MPGDVRDTVGESVVGTMTRRTLQPSEALSWISDAGHAPVPNLLVKQAYTLARQDTHAVIGAYGVAVYTAYSVTANRQSGVCANDATMPAIAARLGLGLNTVRRAVEALVAAGWMTPVRRTPRGIVYRIHTQPVSGNSEVPSGDVTGESEVPSGESEVPQGDVTKACEVPQGDVHINKNKYKNSQEQEQGLSASPLKEQDTSPDIDVLPDTLRDWYGDSMPPSVWERWQPLCVSEAFVDALPRLYAGRKARYHAERELETWHNIFTDCGDIDVFNAVIAATVAKADKIGPCSDDEPDGLGHPAKFAAKCVKSCKAEYGKPSQYAYGLFRDALDGSALPVKIGEVEYHVVRENDVPVTRMHGNREQVAVYAPDGSREWRNVDDGRGEWI